MKLDLINGPLVVHDVGMFTVHCPHHGATMLLGSSRIEAIENTTAGPVVHWRCSCGTRGRFATGRTPVTRASR